MRFNDTVNHQLHPGGGRGTIVVRAANVTSSAVVIRIFNTPSTQGDALKASSLDESNADVYGATVPANQTYDYEMNAQNRVFVYNATANAINWSTRDG